MYYYKLTNPDGTSYGGCRWGEGVQHITSGEGPLCSAGWTHWYTDPLLAVFLDPLHSDFGAYALLWEGDNEGGITLDDNGIKVGLTHGRTLRRVPKPEVTILQRAAFAILCALAVYHEPGFGQWARRWLNGVDRTYEAAAKEAAAEEAAAWAARAAAWAARAARAAWAAEAAAWVAWVAARRQALDLPAIARQALTVQ